MEHESPIMKAMRELAMADPENCDQEWAAYLALVSVKEPAPATSPTNSSSPLHHHTPAAAVTAPSTTRSTTSLPVLSSIVFTDDFTVEDLGPAAWRLLYFLGGGSSSPTPATVLPSSTTTTPTTPAASRVILGTKHAPSGANSSSGITGLAAATTPAEKDIRAVTPTYCSTLCPGRDTSTASTPSSQVASSTFSPASPTTVSTVLPAPTEVNNVHDAESAVSAPITCSVECPSHDTSESEICDEALTVDSTCVVPLSTPPPTAPAALGSPFTVQVHCSSATSAPSPPAAVPTSSASTPALPTTVSATADVSTMLPVPWQIGVFYDAVINDAPTSCTTTCGTVPKLAAPADSDKALDIDVKGGTAPKASICLPGGHDDSTSEEETVDVTVTLWSAPRSVNAPGGLPGRLRAPLDVLESFMCSPTTRSPVCSGCSIDMSPRLLAEVYKVFHDVCRATAFVPWPPPSLAEPPSTLGMCITLSTGTTAFGCHFCPLIDVWLALVHVQFQQLTMAKFPAVMYLLAHAATMCRYFSTGNLILLSVAAKPFNVVQYWKESQATQWEIAWPSTKQTRTILDSTHLCLTLECSTVICYLEIEIKSLDVLDWRMLITVNGAFAREQFHWDITVQQSTSSVLFLATLDGRPEVYHQLQGNYRCPELMHRSFSQSLVQPEKLFFTPGHILVCCCALVQWEIPWINILVSLRSWFQCYHTQSEFLCSWENFQWTITWFLSYHLSLSIPWFFSCHVLVDCLTAVIAGFDAPTFLWLQLAIKCSLGSPPELLSNSVIELKPWPSWERFSFIAAVISSVGAFHMLACSVFHLKGIYSRPTHYIHVHILDAKKLCTLVILHAGKLYWLLVLLSSCDQIITEGATIFESQYSEWQIPWVPISYDYCITNEVLDQWCISNVDKEVQVAFPLSAQSPYKAVQLPWGPGDCSAYALHLGNPASMDTRSSFSGIDASQLPWDPGGSTRVRLEGKPDIKEGGLSTTSLLSWPMGRHSWAWPVPKTPALTTNKEEGPHGRFGAWNGRVGLGLEGEDRLGLACVAWSTSSSRFHNLLVFFL